MYLYLKIHGIHCLDSQFVTALTCQETLHGVSVGSNPYGIVWLAVPDLPVKRTKGLSSRQRWWWSDLVQQPSRTSSSIGLPLGLPLGLPDRITASNCRIGLPHRITASDYRIGLPHRITASDTASDYRIGLPHRIPHWITTSDYRIGLPHRITASDYRTGLPHRLFAQFEMATKQVHRMDFTVNISVNWTQWKELIVADERESRQHVKAQ